MRSLLLVVLLPGLSFAQPKVDPAKPLTRIVFGSCNDQDKPCPAWDAIAKQKPDLLLFLGDTIYADLDKKQKVTAELIKSKYDQLDTLPAFKILKSTVPMLGVYDDHDFGKNDGDVKWPLKDDAQKILLDFYNVPLDSPRRSRKGVYHAEVYGPPGSRIQVIMLDGRYHLSGAIKGKYDPRVRTTPYIPNSAEDATFLGNDQWAWLEVQLKQPAEIRLLCSGIQVLSEDHPFEKWMNMPNERAKLYKLLRDTKAEGVIVLSGDRHLAELSMSLDALTYPLYDMTSSGFNQATPSWRPPERNRHRVAAVPFGNNYGLVEIDWSRGTSPLVSLQLHDDDGRTLVRHDIRAGMLKPSEQAAGGDKFGDKAAKLPEGVISATEALTKVGDEVTMQFAVKASNKTKDGKRLFLNSDADFKGEQNFTVVLTGAILTEGKWKDADPATFKGKTVRVKGKVSKFQEKPQIVVNDEKTLEVVE